jgi:RHS repeat-associated protein
LDEPLAITDGTKTRVWSAYLEPWGQAQVLNSSPVQLGLRLPGQWEQFETGGFFQNWHRDYDPNLGRYIQADPLGVEAGQNLYGYVDGDALNAVDPNGLVIINLLPKGDKGTPAARAAIDVPGLCRVFAHGSPTSVAGMNAKELNRKINESCGPRMPVKLDVCDAGKGSNSIGEQLAKIRGTPVQAATKKVWSVGPFNIPIPMNPVSQNRKSPLNSIPNPYSTGSWKIFLP